MIQRLHGFIVSTACKDKRFLRCDVKVVQLYWDTKKQGSGTRVLLGKPRDTWETYKKKQGKCTGKKTGNQGALKPNGGKRFKK